jgi:predicted DNA-binding transcriptional regulator YafY
VEQWILGWGAQAEVISPPELRTKMQETIKKLATMYS